VPLPPLPFGRRAMQANILPTSPVDIDHNLNPAIYSQERNQSQVQATFNIWAHAIPCPYKYWATIEPFQAARAVAYPPSQRAANPYCDAEIPADLYFLPVLELTVTNGTSDVTSGARSLSGNLNVGHSLVIRVTNAADNIAVTVTISGTGGYTLTRTIVAADQVVAGNTDVRFPVPVPWDEQRTFTATWTGGGATGISLTFATSGIVLTTAIPNGATACEPWPGRFAAVRSSESINDMPTTGRSVREWHRYVGSFYRFVGVGGSNYVLQRYARGSTFGSFGMRSLAWQPDPISDAASPSTEVRHLWTTDPELPYAGLPLWHDGELKTTCLLKPSSGYVRRCLDLWVYINAPAGSYTITLERGANWGTDLSTPTTIGTIAVTHPGGDAFYQYAGPYPIAPNANGGRVGYVRATCFGAYSCVVGWSRDDYYPSPITIPTTDGKAIPASVVEDSLVPAKASHEVAVSGGVLSFADVPADVELFHLRFNDLPRGFYRCVLRRSDGTQYTTVKPWGISELGEWAGLKETGDPVFVRHGALGNYWGDFGKSTRTDRFIETYNMEAITPAPFALSVGVNDIADSAAHFGYSSLVDANDAGHALSSFTAPAAGRYRFLLDSTANGTWRGWQLALWASLDDVLCLRQIPDVVEPSMPDNTSGTFAAEPPTPSGAAGLRTYYVKAATGVWAGREGQRARGYYDGAGGVIVYRFDALPIGYRIFGGSPTVNDWYWSGTAWIERRLEYLRYEATLAEDQVLHLRVARVTPMGEYGERISVGGAGYLRMTVTAL
jgi:hypothetical protein